MGNLPNRIVRFVRQAWSELRKVAWPTQRQTAIFTGIVFFAVTVVALMIWAVDSILGRILTLVIRS